MFADVYNTSVNDDELDKQVEMDMSEMSKMAKMRIARNDKKKKKKQLQKEIRQYIPNGHDHSNHVRRMTTEKWKEKGNHLS